MIVDTSALLAFFNSSEPAHQQVVATLSAPGRAPLVVSPYVVVELDYLIATRVGVAAELAVLQELAGGSWELPVLDAEELASAATVIEKYADQSIGLADASLVVLAQKYATRTIATLDRRHFSVVRPLGGGRFSLVP